MGSAPEPASGLGLDLSKYPKLSREQVGHLRHFHNLVSQLDGSWHHMGAQEAHQEFLDASRYQLATMAYAVGVAHYHHQAVLRSVYKTLMRRIIHKMLLREVWGYWFVTSVGGVATNPDLKKLREPWADPVVRENIMYSGHLLLMISLYAMLFDDDEFEREGSIVFDWNPLFYGMGPEKYTYNTASLQKVILNQMEKSNWVGVCCEPNLVFVVCNQFPLVAMRYNDVRNGTTLIDEILPKYKQAWEAKGGMVAEDRPLFPDAVLEQQGVVKHARDPGWTAWAAAFMNTWNSDLLRKLYPQQALGHLTTIDGQTRLQHPAIGDAVRELVQTEGCAAGSAETLQKAQQTAKEQGKLAQTFPYTKPIFGYVLMWLSELGKEDELKSLLEYADDHLSPTWERGGLYYPRHDEPLDETLEWSHMDPFTGNAGIAYSRLNVEDGQKKMWDHPWTRETLEGRPWVDGVMLANGVDFLRGVWDEEEKCLLLTMRAWDGQPKNIGLVFKNLAPGAWKVYVGGKQVKSEHFTSGGELAVSVEVADEEVDVVAIGA